MKLSSIAFIGVLGLFMGISPLVRADQTEVNGAATQPSTVAVTPFNVLADSGHEWIGKAVAEGLASELQKSGRINATSIAVAGESNATANWTITGTVQIMDDQMRIDARLTRVADGSSKSITASGGVRDLFALESNLAGHAEKMLAPAEVKTASAQTAAPTIDLISPAAIYQPTYFDNDLRAALATPDRFANDENRYNYQPTNWGLIESVGFMGCGSGGSGGCGGSPAGPVGGW